MPVALGALKLKPWEFGALTFDEFNIMVNEYRKREEYELILQAKAVCTIANCSGNLRRPLTVEKYLGFNPSKKKKAALKPLAERQREAQQIADMYK